MIICTTVAQVDAAEHMARQAGHSVRRVGNRVWVRTGNSLVLHATVGDPDAVTVDTLRSELADSKRDTRESKAVQP